jgi:hypothetical protein
MSTHRITPVISNEERYNRLRALLTEIVVIDEEHRLDLLEGGYERIAALFRKEAQPTPDLARLSEAAAKESCVALCFDSPYVLNKLSSIITRHFKSMAQEVAEARSKETGYQKAIANYDDWVKRRTETVAALRAENERLRQERDAARKSANKHLSACIEYKRNAERDRALYHQECGENKKLHARVAALEQNRERAERLFAASDKLYAFLAELKNWPLKDIPNAVFVPWNDAMRAFDAARHPGEQPTGCAKSGDGSVRTAQKEGDKA